MGCFVRLGCFLPLVGQVRRRTVIAGELCAHALFELVPPFTDTLLALRTCRDYGDLLVF